MTEEVAEELFRQVSAFASFGFAKSHAAAFARTAYESSFLKLFYPAQFLVGLINAQPMGFYPVEVLVNDAKRHGVAVLPVDLNASSYATTTEWVGRPGWALAGAAGDDGSHDADPPATSCPRLRHRARPAPVRSSSCVIPGAAARSVAAESRRLGRPARAAPREGIGEQHEELLDRSSRAGRTRRSRRRRADGPARGDDRAADPDGRARLAGRPRRELLWQLREVAGASRAAVDGQGACARRSRRAARPRGRPADGPALPATEAPDLPRSPSRSGSGMPTRWSGSMRGARSSRCSGRARSAGRGAERGARGRAPGPVRIGGLVVTRQHPMTAKGTVFLALEDETGMVNVTLWPDTWARLRGVVRRHACSWSTATSSASHRSST
jgi:error-prone DNA polymerase